MIFLLKLRYLRKGTVGKESLFVSWWFGNEELELNSGADISIFFFISRIGSPKDLQVSGKYKGSKLRESALTLAMDGNSPSSG